MLQKLTVGSTVIEYELIRKDRKTIQCRVLPDGYLVTAPNYSSIKTIEEFLTSKLDWMLKTRERLRKQAEHPTNVGGVCDGQELILCGKPYRLRLVPGGESSARAEGQTIILTGFDPDVTLRKFLIEFARKYLTALVIQYAPVISGRMPGRIAIREQKTRWGSCSSKGNLNFNWKLIFKPPAAIEYVVVHELCHMIHLNHSPAFWNLVERYLPDYKQRRALLK